METNALSFNNNFGCLYLEDTPLALAIERAIECDLLSRYQFKRPVLDVGCGEGVFAKKLFNSKIDVGIDPNVKEISRAKKYDQYIELIACMGDNIPKENESFSTIFSNSVLEHIPELSPVLQEMHRLLKNDGIVYLTLPTDRFEQFSWGYTALKGLGFKKLATLYAQKFNQFWKHYHCYNRNKWQEIFEKSGFQVKECLEYNLRMTCMLNNALAPIAFLSFLNKKILNRWFVFEKLRRSIAPLFYRVFSSLMQYKETASDKGGLIFFALQKQSTVS